MSIKYLITLAVALLSAASIVGCGGGASTSPTAAGGEGPGLGTSGNTPTFSITTGLGSLDPATLSTFSLDGSTPVPYTSLDAGLNGTAAEGGPISNGAVIITDASSPAQTVSVKTNVQGYYFAKVTGFVAPLIVKVISQNGKIYYSFSDTTITAGAVINANITPITDKVTSLVMGTANVSAITPADISTAKVNSAKTVVLDTFSTALSSAGVTNTAAGFDPITSPFYANGSGYDKVLDQVRHEINPDGTTQLFAKTINYDAAGAVVSTPLSPTTALALTSGKELNFARLESLRSRMTACFVQAESARDYNTAGNACAGLAHPNFKSAGRDFAEVVVQASGRKDRNRVLEAADVMTGAIFDAPELLLLENSTTTGTDFDKAIVELRWYQPANQAYRTASFSMRRFDGFAAAGNQRSAIVNSDATSSDWWFYGGQSNYAFGVTPRLSRYTNLNAATNVVAGTLTAPSPSVDISSLGLFVGTQKFNSTTRAYEDSGVAYAKVTGPGLPISGVVVSRIASSTQTGACVTSDDVAYNAAGAPIHTEATYLGYYSSTGITPGVKTTTFTYTASSSPVSVFSYYSPGSPGSPPGFVPVTPPTAALGDNPFVGVGVARTILGTWSSALAGRPSVTTTIVVGLYGTPPGSTATVAPPTIIETAATTFQLVSPVGSTPTAITYSIPFIQTTATMGVSIFSGTVTFAGGDIGTTTVTYPALTASTTTRFYLGRSLPSGVGKAFDANSSVYGPNNALAATDFSLIKPWSRYTIALYSGNGMLLSTETDRIIAQARPSQSLLATPLHDLSPSHAVLTPSQAASPTLQVQWTNNSAAPTPYQVGVNSLFRDAAVGTPLSLRRYSSSLLKRQQLSTSGAAVKTFATADLSSFTGCRLPVGNTSVVERLDSGRTLDAVNPNNITGLTFRSVFLNSYVNRTRISQTTEWAN